MIRILMTIMVAAAATPTYADFFLQIVPTGSGSFGNTTTGLTAPNLNVSLGIGGSAVYEVFAVKNNGNNTLPATITYSSPPFSIVGADPDVTFSWTPTVASGGSFAMTNANTTSANGFKIGNITVNILGSASYGDTRTLTFNATIGGLSTPSNNSNLGAFVSNSLTITAVPEPTSFALVGLTAFGFARFRRKRAKAN